MPELHVVQTPSVEDEEKVPASHCEHEVDTMLVVPFPLGHTTQADKVFVEAVYFPAMHM
jgi:hypothetical protein